MIPVEKIKILAHESATMVKDIREHLHANPELSFNEVQTAQYIAELLEKWDIPFKSNIGGNGIVAWIKSPLKGKNIALRADIDALPIDEKNNIPYCSVNKGVMHACGHDLHTASLLGTLYILNQVKETFSGSVWAIFQPAEEKLPGGAQAMLNDPFFADKQFDAVIAQHVFPDLPAGTIGIKGGKYMASTDEIYVTLNGKGGHAATPHQINDTVLIASQIIVSLQQIVSRHALPTIPTVLSFGKFIANGATNIIPNEVILEGTFRTFNEEWRSKALSLITKIIRETANTHGIEAEIKIVNGYPALINSEQLASKISEISKIYMGNEQVKELEMRMTAEDFAYFAQKYPAVMYRIGTGGTDESSFPLHSPQFNINPSVYTYAHGLMAWITIKLLENENMD
jgi:amidohydrolase